MLTLGSGYNIVVEYTLVFVRMHEIRELELRMAYRNPIHLVT